MGDAADGRPRRHRERVDREFDAFFGTVWVRCQGIGRRMGLSAEEAEDVALDALAITYERWDRVRRMAYPEAWALKVTANEALRHLRTRRPVVALSPAEPSIEEGVTSRLALGVMMKRLPRRQREVVTLRYLADLPEAQVAEALGIDVGSVKVHASRGRNALRLAMGVQEGPGL